MRWLVASGMALSILCAGAMAGSTKAQTGAQKAAHPLPPGSITYAEAKARTDPIHTNGRSANPIFPVS